MGLSSVLAFVGSLVFIFNVLAPWQESLGFSTIAIAAGLLAAIAGVLIAGALWGYVSAWLLGVPAQPIAWPAARTYGLSLLVIGLVLEITMVPLLALAGRYQLNIHSMFIVAFVPTVGILCVWNVSRLARLTGRSDLAVGVGRLSGIAAGLAFLLAGLFLQYVLNWQVGRPSWGHYNMITLMHICNACAAFAGGSVAGWVLSRRQKP
jgi:hypothetical protein